MLERTLRRSLGLLMTCFVISAVLLRLTKRLLGHTLMLHKQVASIEWHKPLCRSESIGHRLSSPQRG
jgi:hypothetical protein